MLITPKQLNARLEAFKGDVFTIAGDEPLTKEECLDRIRKQARSIGAEERSSFVADRYFDWQKIIQLNQSISLFSSHRIIEITLPTGKPGVDGAKALVELATKSLEDTTLIILLPSADRDTKNSKWFAALMEHLVIEVKDISINELPRWIAERMAAQEQKTDQESLVFIAQQVEGNMLAAHQEIQKLGLLYPAGNLSAEEVKDAVLNVARFDAFQLGEAMLAGDTERTARILEGLKDEGEQPVAVMNPILWLVKPLLKLKQAQQKGQSIQSAMSSARVFGARQALLKQAMQRLSLKQVEAALQKLADIDRIAKGVLDGDAWQEISRLCFGLARIRPRRR